MGLGGWLSVTSLPHKQKDLSLGSQHPCERLGMQPQVRVGGKWRVQTGKSQRLTGQPG